MNKELTSVIKSIILFVALGYVINKAISLIFFRKAVITYNYSIEILFLFFGILSTIIVLMLVRIKKKSIDYVGMSFLLLTSVKMVISYIFSLPIVSTLNTNKIEKANFFFIFIYFLILETVITIKLLNQKQK